MKKIIGILLITLFSVCVFAQEPTEQTTEKEVTEYVTDSNVEKLVDKYSDKIGAALEALAEKLEQPVGYVWDAFVKVNFAKGIVQMLFPICFLICFIAFIKLLPIINNDSITEAQVGVFTVICLIGIICLIGTAFTITDAIPRLIAPEYYALTELMQLLK
jgi:hypothetical protein